MKLINFIISIVVSLVVGVGVFCAVKFYQIPKIGFVKVNVIMDKYQGFLDASKTFDLDMKVAQANLDTIKGRYIAFRKTKPNAFQITQADQELNEYQLKFSDDMNKRRAELIRPAIESINSYIADYGKKNHYKIILGATVDGNILYAEEADDLTQTILKDLNDIYNQKHKK